MLSSGRDTRPPRSLTTRCLTPAPLTDHTLRTPPFAGKAMGGAERRARPARPPTGTVNFCEGSLSASSRPPGSAPRSTTLCSTSGWAAMPGCARPARRAACAPLRGRRRRVRPVKELLASETVKSIAAAHSRSAEEGPALGRAERLRGQRPADLEFGPARRVPRLGLCAAERPRVGLRVAAELFGDGRAR